MEQSPHPALRIQSARHHHVPELVSEFKDTMTSLLKRTLLAVALLTVPTLAHARKPKQLPDHWVATWATAEVGLPVAAIPADSAEFIPGAADATLREIVHTSIPTGLTPLVRLEFTNALGTEPLTLGEIHIALADPKTAQPPTGDISLITANALTFNGASSVTIRPGAEVISDPVALALPADADLVISIFLPAQKITTATFHPDAFQTNFFAPGNVVSQRSLAMPPTQFKTTNHWWFLKSVDVQEPAAASTIVAFGDSITDGYGSTPNKNQRWPSILAQRIADQAEAKEEAAKQAEAKPKSPPEPTQTFAVVDEGIGGNRILLDGYGPSALARFTRDVLAMPGVSSVILLEGINDIGVATGPPDPRRTTPATPLTAAQLEDGLSQLAAQAHAHNIKAFGATLTPYQGAGYFSPAGEAIREQLNTWIRTTPLFDGVIDFDKAVASPTDPIAFNPAYDHGDHLHPSDAGYKAMADAIELSLFAK
jgi:lysophospholipase L1-like esterase